MQIYKEAIRSKGLRVTPARVIILKILEDSKKPLDILSIAKEMAKMNVFCDQATLYRIIENFLEKNMIRQLQFHEKKFYYETNRVEHHHAVCENCGKVEDIMNCNLDKYERDLVKNRGFEVKNHSLEFFGLCKDCRNKN